MNFFLVIIIYFYIKNNKIDSNPVKPVISSNSYSSIPVKNSYFLLDKTIKNQKTIKTDFHKLGFKNYKNYRNYLYFVSLSILYYYKRFVYFFIYFRIVISIIFNYI